MRQTCEHGRWGSPFYLVPTNATLSLTSTDPPWGPWFTKDGKSKQLFSWETYQHTHWRALPHALIHRLAHHPARTADVESACYCVVAALGTPVLNVRLWQKTCGTAWRQLCPPSIPLVVVDSADVDYASHPLCDELWVTDRMCAAKGYRPAQQAQCCSALLGNIMRVSGGPIGIFRQERLPCVNHSLTVPWIAHTRSATRPPDRSRRIRTSYAMGYYGHFMAHTKGFTKWRKALIDACSLAGNCKGDEHVPMGGEKINSAVNLYAESVFCLMPPGDVLSRAAIIDAIAVGCVPVFFHRLQSALWPLHWDGRKGSVLFDWSRWSELPKRKLNNLTVEDFAPEAQKVLQQLATLPSHEVLRLQRAVREIMPAMVYTLNGSNAPFVTRVPTADSPTPEDQNTWPHARGPADAVETLIHRLPELLEQRGWVLRRSHGHRSSGGEHSEGTGHGGGAHRD